jgi:hypothetical protein
LPAKWWFAKHHSQLTASRDRPVAGGHKQSLDDRKWPAADRFASKILPLQGDRVGMRHSARLDLQRHDGRKAATWIALCFETIIQTCISNTLAGWSVQQKRHDRALTCSGIPTDRSQNASSPFPLRFQMQD